MEAPFFINTTIGEGTFFALSGFFTIPSGAMQITASGAVGGSRRDVLSTSAAAGFGLLDQRGRALVFAQSFVAGDVTVDIELEASIDNLMPTVRLPSAPRIECNASGGASIGEARDASHNGTSFTFEVQVPHDRVHPMGCTMFGGTPVDVGDPRCVPEPAPASSARPDRTPVSDATPHGLDPARGGCDASETQGSALVLLVLAAMLRRRR